MDGCFSFDWTRWDVQPKESWEMAPAELVVAAAATAAAAAAAAAGTAVLNHLHRRRVQVMEVLAY